MAVTVVAAKNIEVVFGSNQVLRDVSMAIEMGEAVAIVGANGAGKTTLIKVLAGVLKPSAGVVTLGGDELPKIKRRQVARRVAVVPQGAPQVFSYRLLEFVLMGYHARTARFSMPSTDQIDGARQALVSLELGDLEESPVSHLSGGELQRALMARAMVASVPLWLLDEPTASLDMRHQVALLEQMRRHVDDGGSAVAILHDLALIHRFFDRVLVLHEGVFLADGAPDEVLVPDVVSQIFAVPMQRGEVEGKVVWVVA